MKKLNQVLRNYLVFAFPFVVTWLGVERWMGAEWFIHSENFPLRAAYELFSWITVLWIFGMILMFLLMVISRQAREVNMAKLAGIQERDEREEFLTARGTRFAFLSTNALLVLLIFASGFTMTLAKKPNGDLDKRNSVLMFGFGLGLLDSTPNKLESKNEIRHMPLTEGNPAYPSPDFQTQVQYEGIPLTKSALLILILLWNLVTFRLRVRKELRV